MLPKVRFTQMKFPDETEVRCKVMHLYHDHPLAGHPSITNTTHLLLQQYKGPGMKEFTADYVCGCITCQENKPQTTHRHALLQIIPVEPHQGPFQVVAMDLITDLPKLNGFNAILTIIDQGCLKAAKFILYTTYITGEGVATLYL